MSSRSRPIRIPPAAVLALSVLLCGGVFVEPTTAAVLLQRADEASCATAEALRRPGQGASRDRKAMGALLSYLADAARQLRQLQDRPTAPVATIPGEGLYPAATGAMRVPRAMALTVHPLRAALPHHLDLPPPTATL